jgi:serine/threonine protein kinase
MKDTNIMMPLDLLSDERNLYSIMPYCDGGELFERLDLNERFSEDEARYWMDQVLNVSSTFAWKITGDEHFFLTYQMNVFVSMVISPSLLRSTMMYYYFFVFC